MIALPNQECFHDVLPLLKTLFDIALLRKGPDSIPHSPVLLMLSIGLWSLAAFVFTTLIDSANGSDIRREVLGLAIATGCYFTVIAIAGFGNRVLQTITALIGCGALIFLCFTASLVTVGRLTGAMGINLLVVLYLMWSISVEGHIIGRAVDRPLYVGILIALVIFVLQYTILRIAFPTT